MIQATHKDGTPVALRDRVLAVWDNGRRCYGTVTEIRGEMRFSERGGVRLQTYTIHCDDGQQRPAYAWAIKAAWKPGFRKQQQRRAA